MGASSHTTNLNLPIYSNPAVDTFDLTEWNNANNAIESAYNDMNTAANKIGSGTLNTTATDIIGGINEHEVDINNLSNKTTLGWINAKYPPAPLVGIALDGETDDTTALQNLINTLPDGSALFIPKGICRIVGSITINKRFVIEGIIDNNTDYTNLAASTGTIIRAEGSEGGTYANSPVFDITYASNADQKTTSLKNLHFIGSTSNTSLTNAYRLAVKYTNSVMTTPIENCYFAGFKYGALKFDRAYDGVMQNVRIMFCGTDGTYPAIHFTTTSGDCSNNWKIDGLHIENCPYDFRADTNTHSIFMTNCKFEIGNWMRPNNSLWVFDASTNIKFTNCYFLYNDCDSWIPTPYASISAFPYYFNIKNYSHGITFTNCSMYTHNAYGAKWISAESTTKNCQIIGGNIHACALDYSFVISDKYKFDLNTIHLKTSTTDTTVKKFLKCIGSNASVDFNTFWGDASDATPTTGSIFYVASGNYNNFTNNNLNNCVYYKLIDAIDDNTLGYSTVKDVTTKGSIGNIATPNIAGKQLFFLSSGSAVTITNLLGGNLGVPMITLFATNGNTTIKHNAGGTGKIVLKTGADFTMAFGNAITLAFDSLYWYEVSRV